MDNFTLPVTLDRILEEARLKAAITQDHLQALSQFGIDQKWLTQMNEEINQVANIPTFDGQKIQLKELTSIKNEKLEACREWGKTLRLRMNLATQDKQLKGVEFPTTQWNDAYNNESKLITLFPTLITLAKNNATILATVGQTSEMIKEGEKCLEELISANESQEEYNIKRKTETIDRQALYRSLYDRVNRINKIGQMVFANDPKNLTLFSSNWQQNSSSHSTTEKKET